MLEGYTTLGFLAAHTSTVELQLLVTGVTYRHPGLLAKIVSTLDVLSGGRAALGLGAAWYEREHAASACPSRRWRNGSSGWRRRCRSCTRCGATTTGPTKAGTTSSPRTVNSPQPLRRPHPPIMIGGGGEKKTLRLVAQYADACNLFAGPQTSPDAVAAKLDVLAAHCEREGTDYRPHPQERAVGGPVDATGPGGKQLAEQLAPYADAGVTEVHVMPFSGDPVGFIDHLGEHVLPRLADLD